MNDLDEIDLEILELLLDDARRSYADIADAVGRSPPAVSDRIDRLQEAGVIRRFTIDIDRSQLHGGLPVLLELEPAAGADPGAIRDGLLKVGAVEHVFTTAEDALVAFARVPDSDVAGWLGETVDPEQVGDWSVTLCAAAEWSPDLGATEFAVSCAQCGNTVDSEGNVTRIEGDRYAFCCPSCEARFREQYDRISQGV